MFVSFVALFALLVSYSSAENIRQCLCSEVTPCRDSYVDSFLPCADSCKGNAAAIGADYEKLRECLKPREAQIRAAVECVEKSLPDSCTNETGRFVPKRSPDTLKVAVFTEIGAMLTKTGVASQVQSVLVQGKKFYACMRSCADRRTGNCSKQLGCGLNLPSDSALVQKGKRCAIDAGFDTKGMQELCQCAVGAGLSQLARVCSRLQVR